MQPRGDQLPFTSFILSRDKFLLNIYSVSGSVLGTRNIAVNTRRGRQPSSLGADILGREGASKEIGEYKLLRLPCREGRLE